MAQDLSFWTHKLSDDSQLTNKTNSKKGIITLHGRMYAKETASEKNEKGIGDQTSSQKNNYHLIIQVVII